MTRARKVLAAAIAVWLMFTIAFVSYGAWTRHGAPTFTRGGAFGTTASPTPSSSARVEAARRPDAARAATRTPASPRASASARAAAPPASTTPAASLPLPGGGTYTYDGEGREQVTFGGASPCSWEIDEVPLDVKEDGIRRVLDWTYSDQRVERHVDRFEPDGVRAEFVGSAVTCLGVRRGQEDTYDPPALVMPLPLRVGHTWHDRVRLSDREEEFRGEVVRRERIAVPAGTFDAYVLEITVELSGGSEGRFTTTRWFVPELGVSAKVIARTDVTSGSAHFVSDMTLLLARLP